MANASNLLSAISLALSLTALWLGVLRRGKITMTRPTTFGLLYDHTSSGPRSKIYLRSLLFASAKRGRALESMHAELRYGVSKHAFTLWAFGTDKLALGGGLYVSESGCLGNHHFVVTTERNNVIYKPGKYELRVFGTAVGDVRARELFVDTFDLDDEQVQALRNPLLGVLYTWSPTLRVYESAIDSLALSSSHEAKASPLTGAKA